MNITDNRLNIIDNPIEIKKMNMAKDLLKIKSEHCYAKINIHLRIVDMCETCEQYTDGCHTSLRMHNVYDDSDNDDSSDNDKCKYCDNDSCDVMDNWVSDNICVLCRKKRSTKICGNMGEAINGIYYAAELLEGAIEDLKKSVPDIVYEIC